MISIKLRLKADMFISKQRVQSSNSREKPTSISEDVSTRPTSARPLSSREHNRHRPNSGGEVRRPNSGRTVPSTAHRVAADRPHAVASGAGDRVHSAGSNSSESSDRVCVTFFRHQGVFYKINLGV